MQIKVLKNTRTFSPCIPHKIAFWYFSLIFGAVFTSTLRKQIVNYISGYLHILPIFKNFSKTKHLDDHLPLVESSRQPTELRARTFLKLTTDVTLLLSPS